MSNLEISKIVEQLRALIAGCERLANRSDEPKVCQAPWGCSRPTSKKTGHSARRIRGLSLCRGCYQYVWEQAKAQKVPAEDWSEFMEKLSGPKIHATLIEMRCPGPGCGIVLSEGSARRFIGRDAKSAGIAACKACYQRAWEYQQVHSSLTLEEAWRQMPPRQRRKR